MVGVGCTAPRDAAPFSNAAVANAAAALLRLAHSDPTAQPLFAPVVLKGVSRVGSGHPPEASEWRRWPYAAI